jgi:hypothetical protein
MSHRGSGEGKPARGQTSPTVMRTGSESTSRMRCSTLRGIVAENSSVCRSGRICPTMERTWAKRMHPKEQRPQLSSGVCVCMGETKSESCRCCRIMPQVR